MRFSKWHGIGNDYIIVAREDLEAAGIEVTPEWARALCDRHFGIGADGILVMGPSETADAHMEIRNPDGSTAEMCGNGIRMAARWLVEDAGHPRGRLAIDTAGGTVYPHVEDGGMVRVDMGRPEQQGRLTVNAAGTAFVGDVVRVGNPHFVVRAAPSDAHVLEAGPVLERAEAFPDRTNVEFYEPTGASSVRMRVWERGVGETLACGSGACATGLVAVHAGDATAPVEVELPGGVLEIDVADDGSVTMTGPARKVYDGVLTRHAPTTSSLEAPA